MGDNQDLTDYKWDYADVIHSTNGVIGTYTDLHLVKGHNSCWGKWWERTGFWGFLEHPWFQAKAFGPSKDVPVADLFQQEWG